MNLPTTKIIIGLAGPEGVGKSTLSDAIVWRLPNLTDCRAVAYRESFAQPLYEALAAICRVSVEYIRAHKDEVFTADTAPVPCLIGSSFRKMLQNLGEGFGRTLTHPELWAQLAVLRAKVWEGKRNLIVFDDVRYENEAKQCHVIIELKRPGIDYARTHASNMGLPAHVPREVVHASTPEKTAEYIITNLDMFVAKYATKKAAAV